MDIVEAINTRMSIRAFKPDPVPRQVLEEILELAMRAPSWSNTQPWEFIIVGGSKLEEIKRALDPMIEKKEVSRIRPDFLMAQKYPDLYTVRKQTLGKTIFQVRGIERGNKEKRVWWSIQELKCFDVPNVIYICTDRSYYFQERGVNVWPIFDCGLLVENIMLLAPKYGLGTLASVAAVMCPDALRDVLDIPDSSMILIGILIGYPDYDDPINQIRSERDPLEKVSKWYGFD
jgi:nitroreductase